MSELSLTELQAARRHRPHLPCGGVGIFDPESTTFSYRCNICFAVIGSVGMPRGCAGMYKNGASDDHD